MIGSDETRAASSHLCRDPRIKSMVPAMTRFGVGILGSIIVVSRAHTAAVVRGGASTFSRFREKLVIFMPSIAGEVKMYCGVRSSNLAVAYLPAEMKRSALVAGAFVCSR